MGEENLLFGKFSFCLCTGLRVSEVRAVRGEVLFDGYILVSKQEKEYAVVTDRAFWFKSDTREQEVIPLFKGETHIKQIINNPAKFGEIDKTITSAYKKYDESLGVGR